MSGLSSCMHLAQAVLAKVFMHGLLHGGYLLLSLLDIEAPRIC